MHLPVQQFAELNNEIYVDVRMGYILYIVYRYYDSLGALFYI